MEPLKIATACVVSVLTMTAPLALPQTYPSRPIRVVVPYPAGGASDTVPRLIAQKLADRFVETAERLNEANLALAPQVAGSVRPGKTAFWTLETCRGSPPLSIVATGETPSPSALPGGSLACLSMQLALDDGPWLGGEPIILGSRGQPSRLLV